MAHSAARWMDYNTPPRPDTIPFFAELCENFASEKAQSMADFHPPGFDG
jgi:hypothetical protein